MGGLLKNRISSTWKLGFFFGLSPICCKSVLASTIIIAGVPQGSSYRIGGDAYHFDAVVRMYSPEFGYDADRYGGQFYYQDLIAIAPGPGERIGDRVRALLSFDMKYGTDVIFHNMTGALPVFERPAPFAMPDSINSLGRPLICDNSGHCIQTLDLTIGGEDQYYYFGIGVQHVTFPDWYPTAIDASIPGMAIFMEQASATNCELKLVPEPSTTALVFVGFTALAGAALFQRSRA